MQIGRNPWKPKGQETQDRAASGFGAEVVELSFGVVEFQASRMQGLGLNFALFLHVRQDPEM